MGFEVYLIPLLIFSWGNVVVLEALVLPHFYPFGVNEGDHLVSPNDDGSSGKVSISIPFPFFGQSHNSLYVNTNGVISFVISVNQYTPDRFPLGDRRRLLAPFWADVDTTVAGEVFYRQTSDQGLLQQATIDVTAIYVKCKAFRAAWLLIATWYEVAFYGAQRNFTKQTNTFQAVLVTDGRYSFVIFNYNKLTWTTGTASSGNSSGLGGTPAQAGYNAGDGVRFFNIPGSGTHQVLDLQYRSNVALPGRWMYRVDSKPGGCDMNGSSVPCPWGKVYDPNDKQCYDTPTLFDRDYLQEPHISHVPLPHVDNTHTNTVNGDINDMEINVTLKCEVSFNRNIQLWKNITYHIDWFSEGIHLKRDVPCGTLPSDQTEYKRACLNPGQPLVSLLNSTEYVLNRLISCKVTARYTTSKLNPWCIPKTVPKSFFAGLNISPTLLKVKTCSLNTSKKTKTTTTITITPTIPVRRGYTGEFLNISFWLPSGLALNYDDCAVTVEGTKKITVDVIAECSNVGETTTKVIVPEIHDFHSIFWNDPRVQLPRILVQVESSASRIDHCQAYLDPHYKPFHSITSDGKFGKRYHYAFMGHGDFVLYSNSERNFEVHTRQWSCGSSVTCNCGVVLRDHNDVIEFNCCNEILYYDTATPMHVKLRSKQRLAPGISITQTLAGFNSKYQVLFPSGIQVKVYRVNSGLEVYIEGPRAEHVTNESGLCFYSGQSNITGFANQFRMEPGESYFDRLPKPVNDRAVELAVPCSCFQKSKNKGPPRCDAAKLVNFPNESDKKGTDVKSEIEGNTKKRGKRYAEHSDELTEKDFELFKHFVASTVSKRQKRAIPVGSPFSKQNATRYCVERISNSQVGKLCSNLGTDVQALVDSCSIDLEMTGDTSYAMSAISLLMNECGGIVGRNLSLYLNESNGEKSKVPSFLTNIIKQLCPNDCTFNGRCINGSCICNKGFTAEDCAVSIYQIPDISMLQGEGLCDRRKRPCRKVTVVGTGFLNSTNMTCHVKEFMVINGSWTPNKTEMRLPGVMTDLVLAVCHLPKSPVIPGHFHEDKKGTPAAGLVISVSNNGDHKSAKNLTFISYDSACMSCDVSDGCILKNNSCFINHYCFAPNEPNPIDWCYQCLPDVSNSIWTKRRVNLPPLFSSTTQYYALFQENLELTIDVSDPEGMPATVSLMDGSPSNALMQENVLLWNATSDASTQFFLKATDACQAVSTLNITISLVVCQCQNGTCVPHPKKPRGSGFYECNCIPGFTGVKCETNIDDCQSYPCLRGRCIDGINQFKCICDYGFVGARCDTDYDDCSSFPCAHGNCTDYTGAYRCSCESGYGGQNCNIDINECQSSPCGHGSCVDGVNSYTCQCHNGYTGYYCDVDIDECQTSPCVHGSCVDKVNNYRCICNAGFTGQHCEVVITHCSNDSCYPGVLCTENSNSISCGSCPSGLTGDGKNCKDVNDCVNHTCGNGGSCVDGINNYTCTCVRGFTGSHCHTNIDDCVNRTCANGGSCVDGLNSYSCNCLPGFTGNHCERDIDDCVNQTCANGGSCVNGINSYTCNCSLGFTGGHCENNIDDCFNTTCKNGGSCLDGINNFTCSCLTGYTGDLCEKDFDDCVTAICANGATCVDGVNQYMCICQEEFTGKFCESALTTTVATETSSSSSSSVITSAPSTHEKGTTTKPQMKGVSDERKTVFTFEIRINEDWDENLKDKSSEKFKELSKLLKEEIMKAYSGNSELEEVEIISMRSGSIIADFKLEFKASVTVKEAMAPLIKETADGKLGRLGVDPNSLKPKISKQDEKQENESSTINLPLIIGVSCGSFVLLAVITICLVFRCKHSSVPSRNNSDIGEGMPVDESGSKSQNYELQPTKTRGEKIIWMEEKGVCNEGME